MILKKKYIQEICLKEIDEKKGNVMKKKLFLILFILFMISPKNVLATSEKDGWIRESDGYTYYYKNGEMLKGLYVIDGNKYHFGELSGQLKKGWSITLDKR